MVQTEYTALIQSPEDAEDVEPRDRFRVIDRVVDVLSCLSHHPDGQTLTEISRDTGLHKATALRFLKALERRGIAVQGRSGKSWMLGAAFFEMAARAGRRNDLREVSRPIMEDLSRQVNETVQLAILADTDIVYIEKVERADAALKINTEVGSRRPVHCTALGKLLAAYQPPDVVETLLSEAGMAPFTKQTLTTKNAFERELEKIRSAGFSVDDREYNELVVCTAAPVRDATGDVVAGLSISTFGIAADSDRFRELIAAARAGAERLSRRLGHTEAEAR